MAHRSETLHRAASEAWAAVQVSHQTTKMVAWSWQGAQVQVQAQAQAQVRARAVARGPQLRLVVKPMAAWWEGQRLSARAQLGPEPAVLLVPRPEPELPRAAGPQQHPAQAQQLFAPAQRQRARRVHRHL